MTVKRDDFSIRIRVIYAVIRDVSIAAPLRMTMEEYIFWAREVGMRRSSGRVTAVRDMEVIMRVNFFGEIVGLRGRFTCRYLSYATRHTVYADRDVNVADNSMRKMSRMQFTNHGGCRACAVCIGATVMLVMRS